MTSGSMRLTRAGAVKCSSSAMTRMRDLLRVAGLNCGIHTMRAQSLAALAGAWEARRAMRTNVGRFAATLHGWLQIAALILMLAFAAIGVVWSIDPPWRVNELPG